MVGWLSTEEIVRLLDNITYEIGDPETMHSEADEILLMAVDPEVREAYDRVVARADWWAYA